MMGAFFKSTLREIKNSFTRFLAIFIIIALGVGFFAGLRACRPALTETAGQYFEAQNLYDYRFLSSIGFSKDSADALSDNEFVLAAEGALYEDVLIPIDGNDTPIRVHSITDVINIPSLVSGRMPQEENECVVDADYFGEDIIGETLTFSAENSEETTSAFSVSAFVVTGRVRTPLYISADRGTTSLGDGKIAAFLLADKSCFTAEYDTELYLSLCDRGMAYSDQYKNQISREKQNVIGLVEEEAELRHRQIVSDAQKEVDDARAELDRAGDELAAQKEESKAEAADQMTAMGQPATLENPYYVQMLSEIDDAFAEAEEELDEHYAELADAQREVDSIEPPTVYALTRADNAGYASFEQDSTIIENISVVFPAFFFLVAALVCVTTMTRMVEEQRTQAGVLKAIGYGKGRICGKYLFYAGLAGLTGSIAGFFLGTALIPMVFWSAYASVYNFADALLYSFDPAVYAFSLAIAIVCTAGVTVLCCRNVLREVPAAILRPKTPKNGKRILIERFSVWRRVSFLHKVSLRNVIRYKQRFFLMILGISGCTALLLTGFGIRDSIQNVTAYQYGEIILYDAEITFTNPLDRAQQEAFLERHGDMESALFCSVCNADITADGGTKSVNITAAAEGDLSGYMNLYDQDIPVSYPGDGEIILCRGIAEKLGIRNGETVTLTDDSLHQVTVRVTGIFDNYIGNYLFVSEDTMTRLRREASENTAYVRFDPDAVFDLAKLQGDSDVSYVAVNADMRETIETSFSSLNLVVVLIILCAGMLAFVVLFNLININIGERIREIATIKVLGFFNRESSAYIFREVNILTAAGALLGLLLGRFLHAFVMEQIKPDGICFDSRIMWYSYLFSIAITVVFALLVQIVMRVRLKKISMTESLKSVE
ncbi:MAG: FtsX-like permease family protein [Bacteroidales bacterium]|nr:FtsX-like permease family protein [Bacteroidales bacterium]MCM1416798.1 FtsX-like permease family protein [bacterium]MCM1424874.1 FtsX-like permease family protein [bacterium]